MSLIAICRCLCTRIAAKCGLTTLLRTCVDGTVAYMYLLYVAYRLGRAGLGWAGHRLIVRHTME